MRFFDRTKEISRLREIEALSHEVAQFTIISGRRRIGKTELVKKAYEDKTILYFFVARKAESDLCQTFMEEISQQLGIALPVAQVNKFASVFRYVMQLACRQHLTLFIDEFQDFARINPSIFSDMQDIWDRNKGEARINLIVAGSVNTMLSKIFRDKKEPLYGRQTDTMRIRPFPPSVLREIMREYCPSHKPEDLLALYTITGGVAKYVELFVDHKWLTFSRMMSAVFQPDSYFISEGKNMLVEEFGKDYGTYFSILTLMAQGRNTRSEIEDALGGIELSGYFKKLIEDYELVNKHQPMHEHSANKNVHYAINDHFLRFWFRFIYKYQHVIEAGGIARLHEIAQRDYATFSGPSLERYFRDCLRETGRYTRIGYWHDRRGENEIDIVAEDEFDHHLELIEVKRQAKNIDLAALRAKADSFQKAAGLYGGYSIVTKGLSMDDMEFDA